MKLDYKSTFLTKIKPSCLEAWSKHRILPSLKAAQAILESGWGRSPLAMSANNLFGMKAGSNWNGATYDHKGAKWRKYSSVAGSLADHTELLTAGRYNKIIGEKDYNNACKYVYEAGYASDPDYVKLLVSVIQSNGLQSWDEEAISGRVVSTPSADSVSTYKGNIIRFGATGDDVKRIQSKLGVEVDGIFGRNTEIAVKNFQKKNKLAIDGVVGNNTWTLLFDR